VSEEPEPGIGERNDDRAKVRSRPWIAASAILASCGITAMVAALFLPDTRSLPFLGLMLFVTAAGLYTWTLLRRLRRALDQPDLDIPKSMLDAQAESMSRLEELTRRIEAKTRALKLERVEEESYAHILGLDPDEIAFMEWPDDGLRDVVVVYFIGQPPIAYRLTIDQMNEVAETINQRMDGHDREDGQT
jgi:hypothetical protein